jgi:hypothetical protein
MFKGLNHLKSWELDYEYFPDGRERFVDHMGTHLVQVWVQVELWQHYQIPELIRFSGVSRFCLAGSTFGNSLSSLILGYWVCMPTRCYFNVCRELWITPCLKWSSSRFGKWIAISISEHKPNPFWLIWNLSNNSKSVVNQKKLQL